MPIEQTKMNIGGCLNERNYEYLVTIGMQGKTKRPWLG
jgi:hypothetical protein